MSNLNTMSNKFKKIISLKDCGYMQFYYTVTDHWQGNPQSDTMSQKILPLHNTHLITLQSHINS